MNIAFKIVLNFFWWVNDVDVERKNCDYTSNLSIAAFFVVAGSLVDLIISESKKNTFWGLELIDIVGIFFSLFSG